MKRKIIFLICGICWSFPLLAQDTLVGYWSFDTPKTFSKEFSATGIKQNGFSLTGENYFHPAESVGLHNSFSLAMWFYVDSLFEGKTLFCQKQYFKDALRNHLAIKFEKQKISVNNVIFNQLEIKKGWHFFAFTYNDCESFLYLDSVVERNDKIKINHSPFYTDSLFFGSSLDKNSFLTGIIDEIMIFSKPLSQKSIEKLRFGKHFLKDTLTFFPLLIKDKPNIFENSNSLSEKNIKLYWNFEKDSVFGSSNKKYSLSYINNPSVFSYNDTDIMRFNRCVNLKEGKYLKVSPYFYFPENFVFSFWFSPQNMNSLQTILCFQNEKQLFKVNILCKDSLNVVLKNESNVLNLHLHCELREKEWNFFYCTFDNCNFKIFLGYNEVYSGKIPFQIRNNIIFNESYFGRDIENQHFFIGYLDNILLYDLSDAKNLVVALRLRQFPPANLVLSDTTKYRVCSFQNRPSKIVREMKIEDTKISVRMWDNDVVDGDSLNIVLNNTDERIFQVKGKYNLWNFLTRKGKTTFHLIPEEKNCLVFYALNTGKFPPNTARVQIECNKKTILDTLIESTLDTNAAILFIPKPKIPIKEKTSLEINDTNILFLITDASSVDGDVVNVSLNDSVFLKNYVLKEKFDTIPLILKSNFDNVFVFESVNDGNSANNTAKIEIRVKGNLNPIRTFSLQAMKGKEKERLIIKHRKKQK